MCAEVGVREGRGGRARMEQSAAGCSFFLLSLTGHSRGSSEVTEPRTNPILGWLTCWLTVPPSRCTNCRPRHVCLTGQFHPVGCKIRPFGFNPNSKKRECFFLWLEVVLPPSHQGSVECRVAAVWRLLFSLHYSFIESL